MAALTAHVHHGFSAVRAFGWALLAWTLVAGIDAAIAKRVLVLNSFGPDFAPYDSIAPTFRTALAQRFDTPITFVEASLDYMRTATDKQTRTFIAYLNDRFDGTPPDVVVTFGGPAAQFYLTHRDELFGTTPVVLGALEERFIPKTPLLPKDAIVGVRVHIPEILHHIERLLPQTQTIVVVIGASRLERFWLGELKREAASFTDRIRFEYLNDLSLVQMQARVAALPAHSAILYAVLVVDAAGVPHQRRDALVSLHKVANAPIFGIYANELGSGVVGGPSWSLREQAQRVANATLRALGGAAQPQPQVDILGLQPAVYDWRELRRWNIDMSRLPPGSEVRFKPPSVWEMHRGAVVAALTALVLETALIAALLVQRTRRRRAEREVAGLAGRLVTAHEDERRRLARELHDDVSQRLAGLAIEAAALEGRERHAPDAHAAQSIREGLVELGEDVHALSYRLHPSVLEDLGLAEALRIECDRVAQRGSLHVRFDCGVVSRSLHADVALCLFRVAQEALRNVERHAGATDVDVSLAPAQGGMALAVRDNGAGFDAGRDCARASLGLASMRERIRLVGGRLDLRSERGNGTSLMAWVPLPEAA
ncbi:MAG: sensor histidine kinase [Burkholderiales bacterium]|nr:sensor histidine kinase [Burkholderiales bacterium]